VSLRCDSQTVNICKSDSTTALAFGEVRWC